jgi:hypothetical protein
MSIQIVDTSASAASQSWSSIVPFDGTEYFLFFDWSARESVWYLSILDQNQNVLAGGIPIVVTWPLLRRFWSNPALPQGCLMAVDLTGQNRDIAAQTDLGQRVLLTYATPDEPSIAGLGLTASG